MIEVPVKMALPVPRAVRIALALARLCALVACAIGALVLASWHFDLSALAPLLPELHSIAPNAAAGVFAAGIGLFCVTFKGLRPLAWLIGIGLVAARRDEPRPGVVRFRPWYRSGSAWRCSAASRRLRGDAIPPHGSRHRGIAHSVRARPALRQGRPARFRHQPGLGDRHAGAGADRAHRLRLWRRHRQLPLPLHRDVSLRLGELAPARR